MALGAPPVLRNTARPYPPGKGSAGSAANRGIDKTETLQYILSINLNLSSKSTDKKGGVFMGYTIRQISAITGISPYVLRYYEKEGLLPHVCRAGNGFRQYSEEDLEWLGLICCLKNTGMSLKQIKTFVDLSAVGRETLPKRCAMLEEHKRGVECKVAEMQKQLEKITCKIAYFTAQYDNGQNATQGGAHEAACPAGSK